MSGHSKDHPLEKVFQELKEITFRREQLTDRHNILTMLAGFSQNAGHHEEGDEKEKIQKELKDLSEKKMHLQKIQETLEFKGGSTTHSSEATEIFYVEPPPYPAPQVITDVSKLPPYSAPIRCPYCEQFVVTEVTTNTGKTAWLVCLICAFLGCVAGCCLIPLCMKGYKDIVHKCPKCRSQIHMCTKL